MEEVLASSVGNLDRGTAEVSVSQVPQAVTVAQEILRCSPDRQLLVTVAASRLAQAHLQLVQAEV